MGDFQKPSNQGAPPAAPQGDQTPKAPGADWRLLAILGVVVLFLIAVYINVKYSSKKGAPGTDTDGKMTASNQQPAQRPRPMKDLMDQAIKFQETQAAQYVYLATETGKSVADGASDRTFIVGSQVIGVFQNESQRPDKFSPGRLIDVTHRLNDFPLERLHRRMRFEQGSNVAVAFTDEFPALGLDKEPGMDIRSVAAISPANIADKDPVIGVTVDDKARAYPRKLMLYHDVINDQLGDKNIVVTWSPWASAPIAFERPADTLFGSAALVYEGCNVMYDKETRSLWSTATHQCIAGPRKGEALKPIQTQLVTKWSDWKELHRDSTALVDTKRPLPIPYDRPDVAPPPQYFQVEEFILYPVYNPFDTILPLKCTVFGVMLPDGKCKAYRVLLLRAQGGEFTDTIGAGKDGTGGTKVKLTYDAERDLMSSTTEDGKPVINQIMMWMFWKDIHPDTEIWQEDKLREEMKAKETPVATKEQKPAMEPALPLP